MYRFIQAIVVVLCVGSSMDVGAETTMRFGLAAPEKTPWAAYAHEIADIVKSKTGGEIDIQIFSGSQLGNEQDVIRQVARGRIQVGSFSNTAASLMVPEIALLAAPYLWDDLAQADCALDNHLISAFQQKFLDKGLVILGWSEVGYMGYAFNAPTKTLKELTGVKMRVAPTKASFITANAFGANPVVLPITEVASALQTGLVEGADLPGLAFTSLGLSKIARNWISSNHSHQVGLVLMSAKAWKKLSATEQAAFIDAQKSPVKLRQNVRGAEKALLDKFEKEGGRLIKPTDTELKEWREQAKPARADLIREIGGDAVPISAVIEKAKNACRS